MSLLAADINDTGIALHGSDKLLYREPGYALLDDKTLTIGADAYKWARIRPRHIQDRFWSNLTVDGLADARFQHLTAADLVSRQLEQMWRNAANADDRLVIAVPAYMKAENLGLLLGIASELKIPVAALVDAAVAATRREYVNARPVHIDLSLHSALLTRIGQAGKAQVEKSVVVEDAGLVSMYQSWITALSEVFVQQSRFDPLHTAETEQLLLDNLPGWLKSAAGGGTVILQLEYGGLTHRAEIEALTLVAAVAPVYQRIVSQLRALFRADETPALQLTDRAARLPGLADMLRARVGGEVFLLESGATARGLLARCRDMEAGNGQVSLVRQLPWDQAAVEFEFDEKDAQGGRPTHILFNDIAYAIDEQTLNIGTQAVAGERWIGLAGTMPGISRRHCSLSTENGQCVLRDYSRYGSFLNGHRVDGSAVLQLGDVVRIGTPGYELCLITTEQGNGA